MATNTANTVARYTTDQKVHTMRKGVAFADLTSGTAVTIGKLPSGAIIDDAYVVVTTAFDSGTSDLMDMGTSGDPNGFMSAVSVASVGKKSADDLATSDDLVLSADTDVSVTWTGAGAAATAGAFEAVVKFIVDNDA